MLRCRARRARLPATAQIRTHRLDFSSFPIIGYSLTSDTVPQKDLWELATYEIKPRLNGLPGVASVLVQGGQRPEFHVVVDPPRMLRAKASVADIVNAVNRTNVIDSPGFLTRNHQLFLGLITGQVRTHRRHRRHRRQAREQRAGARPGRRNRRAGHRTRLHLGQRQRKAGAARERQPAARQQHRSSRRRSAPGDGRDPADAAGRHRDAAVLRPVEHRPGVDCQRP